MSKKDDKEIIGFKQAFKATLGYAAAQLTITLAGIVILALIYLMVTL